MLQSTQRGFGGALTPQEGLTEHYKRWVCIAPHLLVLHAGRHSASAIDERDRPCIRWTAKATRDTATYDLACLRYHDIGGEFHFWIWNSERAPELRVPFNRYYRPFSQIKDTYTSTVKKPAK